MQLSVGSTRSNNLDLIETVFEAKQCLSHPQTTDYYEVRPLSSALAFRRRGLSGVGREVGVRVGLIVRLGVGPGDRNFVGIRIGLMILVVGVDVGPGDIRESWLDSIAGLGVNHTTNPWSNSHFGYTSSSREEQD
jgi:hypothetical protein